MDALIKVYEEDLDRDKRLKAIHRIDEIVHDEAFYIPFWSAPYIRVVHWDHLRFPEFWLPRRTEQLIDWLVYWEDPQRKAALEAAKRSGQALPLDKQLDKDFYGVRAKAASAP